MRNWRTRTSLSKILRKIVSNPGEHVAQASVDGVNSRLLGVRIRYHVRDMILSGFLGVVP